MSPNSRYQILLTNDDGIHSPGLWKAAEALSSLGYVTVAAPREQSSGMGRSLPVTSEGTIHPTKLDIGDQQWTAYAVGGTPGQAVLHAVLEIMPTRPDLVVSGINYGENIGNSITISGTVGAALEAASLGIPALAASLQAHPDYHLSYSKDVDFSTAAYFTAYFGRMLLEKRMPEDVHVLKLDVPDNATEKTPWRITRVSRHRYYLPFLERQGSWEDHGSINVRLEATAAELEPDSDVYTVVYDKVVSVTPLSLDMTSRVNLSDLEKSLQSFS